MRTSGDLGELCELGNEKSCTEDISNWKVGRLLANFGVREEILVFRRNIHLCTKEEAKTKDETDVGEVEGEIVSDCDESKNAADGNVANH